MMGHLLTVGGRPAFSMIERMNIRTFCILRVAAGFLVILTFCSCTSLKPSDFAHSAARFRPDEFFLGRVRSWGVIENRNGEPMARFSTESIGTIDETGVLVVKQVFTHEDGKKQERVWHVRKLDDHRFEGTANDVVGTARGVAYGNGFRWTYTIALKPGNPFVNVHLKQWMYLSEKSDSVFTRAIVKKFGITLREVTETFEKIPEHQPVEAR